MPSLQTSFFGCSGQRCLSGAILVPVGNVADRLLEHFADGARKLKVGNGLDEFTAMGPVISAAHKERVLGFIDKGIEELADLIYQARQETTVVAVANSQAASAAYWLGSQAGKFVAAPGSDAGSIGCFRMHVDQSEAMRKAGRKITFIQTPEHKTEANPFEPLSADAYRHHLDQVEQSYSVFLEHAARGRKTTRTAIALAAGDYVRKHSLKKCQSMMSCVV